MRVFLLTVQNRGSRLALSKLSRQQRKAYGRYNGSPTPDQLTQFFFLDDQDLAEIRTRRTDANRLGYALQLCTLRFLGTAYETVSQVPLKAVKFVARQLNIRNARCRHDYTEHSRKLHLIQLQTRYQYQEFHAPLPNFRFLRWLYARTWSGDESFIFLFDLSTHYLVTHKILLPGATPGQSCQAPFGPASDRPGISATECVGSDAAGSFTRTLCH